jgi:hypothetical protein
MSLSKVLVSLFPHKCVPPKNTRPAASSCAFILPCHNAYIRP